MANIIIIEDESSLLDVYTEALEGEGHVVHSASEGDSGLKLALDEEWDLLFLDIMLPGMDGLAILTELSTAGKLADRHVIVLSNLDNPKVVQECLRLGAAESLNKAEITPQVVLETVEKYIATE